MTAGNPRRTSRQGGRSGKVCQAVPTTSVVSVCFLFSQRKLAECVWVSPAAQAVNKFPDSGAAAKSAGPLEMEGQGVGAAADLGGASRRVGGTATVMPTSSEGASGRPGGRP